MVDAGSPTRSLLSDLVSELPQPLKVMETSRSDLADMMLHRQFAVEPDPEITHDVGTVDR